MNVGLEHYLVVSGLLFCLGLLGVIMRRNLLVIYMCLELMLNAANLALVAMSRFNGNLDGQIMVFFIVTVAAAEVAVGLALIVALYRKRQTAHVEDLTSDEILDACLMNRKFCLADFVAAAVRGGNHHPGSRAAIRA